MKRLIMAFILLQCHYWSKADTWMDSGNYDLSWYINSSSAQEFTISSETEMAAVAYLVNKGYTDFSNKTIKLDKDLNLGIHTWIGIGTDGYRFKGTFLGQGHRIKGVRLTENSGVYPYYGFWLNMDGAQIKDLTIEGTANLNFSDATYPNTSFGALVAYANACHLENCKSFINITYSRSSTTNISYPIEIGGMVGVLNKSSMTYCEYKGDILIDFGRSGRNSEFYKSSSSITVGGLVAYAKSSNIECCGNKSERIKIDAAGSKNTSVLPLYIGGIVGLVDSNSKLTSCFNNTESFEAIFRGNETASMKIGGIAASAIYYAASNGGIYNCYSSTNSVHVTVQSYASNVHCGGLIGDDNPSATDKYKACFRPSDLMIYSLTSFNLIKGDSGSNTYTMSQMKTDDFLTELNLYPLINNENNIWVSDGGFPFIKKKDATAIETSEKKAEMPEFHVINRHLKFENLIDMQIYSINGMLEFSDRAQQSSQLPHGPHILKANGNSCIFYVK